MSDLLSDAHAPPLRMLNCGVHRCQQQCHPGPCRPCPLSPSLVKTCPCGQTPLAKLLELGYSQRENCTDPIPSCGKTCNRPLACGSSGEKRLLTVPSCSWWRWELSEHVVVSDSVHLCEKMCHEGPCGPCSLTSTVRCRCGSKTKVGGKTHRAEFDASLIGS